jgi:hypothetical protein
MTKLKAANIQRAVIPLFLLSPAILFMSCVPEFTNPLPVEDRQADSLLTGGWRMYEEGKMWHLLISSRSDGWMDLFLTSNSLTADSNSNGTLIYEGFSVPIDSEKYLCVRPVAMAADNNYVETPDPNLPASWSIVRYTVSQNRLNIVYLSAEPFKKFITEGKLTGWFKTESYSGVLVTSSSDELKNIFAQECIAPLREDVDMAFEHSESGYDD